MARALVTAPPVRPPRYGFVNAVPLANEPDSRWTEGWTYSPEQCTLGNVADIDCGAASLIGDRTAGTVDGDPFLAYAWDSCASFGFRARDWQGRARRALEANQSFLIAREVWSGGLGITANTPLNDVSATTVTAAAADHVDALACLEQALASALTGSRGLIHMPAGLVAHYMEGSVVTRDGQQLISPMGHLVIPDAGYDGSGPGGVAPTTSQWIYGTDMMSLLLTPIDTFPATIEEAIDVSDFGVQILAQNNPAGFNAGRNDITVWAQRIVGVLWDKCAHLAAEVNVDWCPAAEGPS